MRVVSCQIFTDPRSHVKCRERSPGEEAQPVVLWIIAEESMFQVAKKSISGRRHTLDGYLCEVANIIV